MNNLEAGHNLIREAVEYFDEVERAFMRGSWNIVVRKSQEVVELVQKGMLKILGVEYPKVHDPSDFFIKILEKKGIPLNKEDAIKIVNISAELTEKRAPALYFEKQYNVQDAQGAKEGAGFVLGIIKRILNQINFQV